MTTFYNLESILKSVGAITDQDASVPTGSDLTQRIQFANDALGEWADSYTWKDLQKTFHINATNSSTATVSLPSDFRQPFTSVYNYLENGYLQEYKQIKPQERFNQVLPDKYCYVTGSFENKVLTFSEMLPSGASLQVDYISFPQSLTTLTDNVPITSSQYMVKKVASLILQGRGSPLFTFMQNDAQRLLSNAIEEENVPFGRDNRIPYSTNGMVIGED